jgi:hypothetical protein
VIAFGKKHSAIRYDMHEGAELIHDSNLSFPGHNIILNVYTQEMKHLIQYNLLTVQSP